MALVRCNECGSEISDKAKKCPKCGYEKSSKYCPECGKALSINAVLCPECGFSYNGNMNRATNTTANYNGENYGLAIAGFVCSFLFPLLGLIFGIVVLSSNKGKQNSARSFGLAATIISSIFLVLSAILLLIYIIEIINYTSSYYYYY